MKRSALVVLIFLLVISIAYAQDRSDQHYCYGKTDNPSYSCTSDYIHNETGYFRCYCGTDIKVCDVNNPCENKQVGNYVSAITSTGSIKKYTCSSTCQLIDESDETCADDDDCDSIPNGDDLCLDSRGIVDSDGCSCEQKTDPNCYDVPGITCCNYCEVDVEEDGGIFFLAPDCEGIDIPKGEEGLIKEDDILTNRVKADIVNALFGHENEINFNMPRDCEEGGTNCIDRPDRCTKGWTYKPPEDYPHGIGGICNWQCKRGFKPIIFKQDNGRFFGTCQDVNIRRIRECPSDFVWGTCAESTDFYDTVFAGFSTSSRDNFKASPEYWDEYCGNDRMACYSKGNLPGVNCYAFNNDYSVGSNGYCYNGKVIQNYWFQKTGIRTFKEKEPIGDHEYLIKFGDTPIVIRREKEAGIDGYLDVWDDDCYEDVQYTGNLLKDSCNDYDNNWEYWDYLMCNSGNAYCMAETGEVYCIELKSGECTGGICVNGVCTDKTNSDLAGYSNVCSNCGRLTFMGINTGLDDCTKEICESLGQGFDYTCKYSNGRCYKQTVDDEFEMPTVNDDVLLNDDSNPIVIPEVNLNKLRSENECVNDLGWYNNFDNADENGYRFTDNYGSMTGISELNKCDDLDSISYAKMLQISKLMVNNPTTDLSNFRLYCDEDAKKVLNMDLKDGEPCDEGVCSQGICGPDNKPINNEPLCVKNDDENIWVRVSEKEYFTSNDYESNNFADDIISGASGYYDYIVYYEGEDASLDSIVQGSTCQLNQIISWFPREGEAIEGSDIIYAENVYLIDLDNRCTLPKGFREVTECPGGCANSACLRENLCDLDGQDCYQEIEPKKELEKKNTFNYEDKAICVDDGEPISGHIGTCNEKGELDNIKRLCGIPKILSCSGYDYLTTDTLLYELGSTATCTDGSTVISSTCVISGGGATWDDEYLIDFIESSEEQELEGCSLPKESYCVDINSCNSGSQDYTCYNSATPLKYAETNTEVFCYKSVKGIVQEGFRAKCDENKDLKVEENYCVLSSGNTGLTVEKTYECSFSGSNSKKVRWGNVVFHPTSTIAECKDVLGNYQIRSECKSDNYWKTIESREDDPIDYNDIFDLTGQPYDPIRGFCILPNKEYYYCTIDGNYVDYVKPGDKALCFRYSPRLDGKINYALTVYCGDDQLLDYRGIFCVLKDGPLPDAGINKRDCSGNSLGRPKNAGQIFISIQDSRVLCEGIYESESFDYLVDCIPYGGITGWDNTNIRSWNTEKRSYESSHPSMWEFQYEILGDPRISDLEYDEQEPLESRCILPKDKICFDSKNSKITSISLGEAGYCFDNGPTDILAYYYTCDSSNNLEEYKFCKLVDIKGAECTHVNAQKSLHWGEFIGEGEVATCIIPEVPSNDPTVPGIVGMKFKAQCNADPIAVWTDFQDLECKVPKKEDLSSFECRDSNENIVNGFYIGNGMTIDCKHEDGKHYVHNGRCLIDDNGEYSAKFGYGISTCPVDNYGGAFNNVQRYYDWDKGKCCYTESTCKDIKESWCAGYDPDPTKTKTSPFDNQCGGTINCDYLCR